MAREVASKILDGINDLVIMAPIREGFVEAYEPVTYATRLRIISEALNDIRVAAREFETLVPFSDASERILSLLDFKAGIIDNGLLQFDPKLDLTARRYFYLIATFDGVWEPYMRLIWNPLGSLLDLLFSNCEGYTFAQDNSFEDYITWVRSAQVDSAVFFTTTGVTVSDQLYLRNLEKLQRGQDWSAPDPGTELARAKNADLAMARMALENPGDAAKSVREANPLDAHRLALEALGVFYRLADYYPPLPQVVLDHPGVSDRSDGYLLQRAVHKILEGWDYASIDPLLKPGAPLARFKVLVDWYKSGLKADGSTAFPSLQTPQPDPPFDPAQIQSGVLSSPQIKGGRQRRGAVILMSVEQPDKAPELIKDLLDDGTIGFGGDANPHSNGISCTIGLTHTGLKRLAVSRATIEAFPKEFREGMHRRSPHLGDVWSNHPRNWRLPERNWPAPTPGAPPIEMEEIDLAIVVRHTAAQDDGGETVRTEVARLAARAAAKGVAAVHVEFLENQYDDEGELRDHFGLRDNLSQPRPSRDAERDPELRKGPKRDDARLGEVLCGYGNDRQDDAPSDQDEEARIVRTSPNENLSWGAAARRKARDLQKDGTYLVLRKMPQNVGAFEKFKQANSAKLGGDSDALVAKLLGRHPDGPSLIDPDAADYNDFDYDHDTAGIKCPFASHIRRANPRAVEHGRPSPRLLRRGMSYGPRFAPDASGKDDRPRGLMFMAYNSSIAEQYETIQRWINGGNSTGVASANNDPLTGTPPRPDGKRTFRFEADGKVVRTEIPTPFVGLDWGLYLFVPSKTALQKLAKPNRKYYQTDEFFELAGRRYIDWLDNLPDHVAAAEWKRVLEDFDSKDISQRDITPDVYSGIRFWRGGAIRVGDIDKRKSSQIAAFGKADPQPAVIVAGRTKILQVLTDFERFSAEKELSRLNQTSGSIYVAQQPDGRYEDPELKEQAEAWLKQNETEWTSQYWAESTETNAIINGETYENGFADGHRAGTAVLDWIKRDAEARHGAFGLPGKPELKLELRREYLAPALAYCNWLWFGLPDGNFKESGAPQNPARFMEPGDWSWAPAKGRLPTCPGDCLSPSRHAFYPKSNAVSEALARDHGAAIKEAGRQFADYYFGEGKAKGEQVPGRISSRMFALPGMTAEVAARNVIGIMLGATPPTMGNLQGIFYDWLNEQTLWRHQGALQRVTNGAEATYEMAKQALLEPMSVAICKRPSPELLFRTYTGGADGSSMEFLCKHPSSPEDKDPPVVPVAVNKGDTVYLPLASATQWAICRYAKEPEALQQGVSVVFGGNRDQTRPAPPVHACPGRKLAMGAMLGIVTAFLEVGRIQAQPAGLIVRISDWS